MYLFINLNVLKVIFVEHGIDLNAALILPLKSSQEQNTFSFPLFIFFFFFWRKDIIIISNRKHPPIIVSIYQPKLQKNKNTQIGI